MKRLISIFTVALGCSRHTPPVLVSSSEIAGLEADLTAQLDANRGAHCPRPLLRGTSIPGAADADLVALVEPPPSSPLRACLRLAEDRRVEVGQVLTDHDAAAPVIVAVEAACADVLPPALANAVGHEDSCSPYLIGRRPFPDLRAFFGSRTAVEVVARKLAREGHTADAVRLLLDELEIDQDLWRGRTAAITEHAMTTGEELMFYNLDSLAGEGGDVAALTDDDLTALAGEAERLESGEPLAAAVFRGEEEHFALYDRLMSFEPADWSPPGGWGDDDEPDSAEFKERRAAAARAAGAASTRAEAAISWVAFAEDIRDTESACPPSSSGHACVQALLALAQKRASTPITAGADPERKAIEGIKKYSGVLDQMIELVRRATRHDAGIAALRARLAVLRLRRAGHTCPDLAAFGAEPLATLLRPASIGDALLVKEEPAGTFVVSLPDWATRPGSDPIVAELRCP